RSITISGRSGSERILRCEDVIEVENAARLVALAEVEHHAPELTADFQRVPAGDFGEARREAVVGVRGDAGHLLAEIAEVLHADVGYLAILHLAVEISWPAERGEVRAGALRETLVGEAEHRGADVEDHRRTDRVSVGRHDLLGE